MLHNYLIQKWLKRFLTVASLCLFIGFNIALGQDIEVAEAASLGFDDISSDEPTLDELLQLDEYFVYHVSYGWFHLGQIEVELHKDTTWNNIPGMWLITKMKSNASVPFVGYKEEHFSGFYTYHNKDLKQLYFRADDIDDKIMGENEYYFDYDSQKVYTFKRQQAVDTLDLKEPASGGDLIFFFARQYAGDPVQFQLPIYINHTMGPIYAKSLEKIEYQSYKAFDKKIPTYQMDGDAQFEGPFGFKGSFTSYYGADPYRIPLEVRAKVWIGNVKVRLERYYRK